MRTPQADGGGGGFPVACSPADGLRWITSLEDAEHQVRDLFNGDTGELIQVIHQTLLQAVHAGVVAWPQLHKPAIT